MSTSFRRLAATALTQDLGGTLRTVNGYAFETPPPSGTVRTVLGYAFQAGQRALPIGFTSIAALYQLINSNSSYTTWSASNSTISSPTTDTSRPGANTVVAMTAQRASGFSGTINLYYNRRPLSDISANSVSLGSIPSATTIYALLPTINSKYGCNLAQSDVVDGPVAAGAVFVKLTAASGSYMFQPGTIWLAGIVQSLGAAVLNTNLNGFDNAAGVGPRTRTLALMHFDGANGSTTFTDQTGRVWTPSGSAAISTATPMFGSGSYSNNGAIQNVSTPDAPELRLTGDFTIECFYRQGTSGSAGIILSKTIGNLARVQWNTNNTISVYDDTGTALLTSGTLSAATWYHVAVVKISGTAKLYINGTLAATSASFGTFGNSTATFNLGSGQANTSAPMNGSLDEFRLSPFGRYTTNFTAPTAPFVLD